MWVCEKERERDRERKEDGKKHSENVYNQNQNKQSVLMYKKRSMGGEWVVEKKKKNYGKITNVRKVFVCGWNENNNKIKRNEKKLKKPQAKKSTLCKMNGIFQLNPCEYYGKQC